MARKNPCCYLVTLWVEDEPDVLRRIDILNAAFYRIITANAIKLRRVVTSDYDNGRMELIVDAPRADPSIVPGQVRAKFEEVK